MGQKKNEPKFNIVILGDWFESYQKASRASLFNLFGGTLKNFKQNDHIFNEI